MRKYNVMRPMIRLAYPVIQLPVGRKVWRCLRSGKEPAFAWPGLRKLAVELWHQNVELDSCSGSIVHFLSHSRF